MIGAIIQARMGSTRLPGKVMKKINGKNPMLFYLIQQIKQSKLIESFVVATTDLKEDDIIAKYLKNNQILCFRGNEKDVLDRYYNCAKKFSFDPIIRITADNPLIDPHIIDNLIQIYQNNEIDYLTNCLPRTFPYGTEVEVFSFHSLETAWKYAKRNEEREHVTPFLYNNPNKFKILNVFNQSDQSNFRWTVDYLEDFDFVEKIISEIRKQPIFVNDILLLLQTKPELLKLNN